MDQTPTPDTNATPASVATSSSEHVPSEWPGAFGLYKYSRDAVKKNGWLLLGLIIGYIVVSAACSRPEFGLVGRLINLLAAVALAVVTTQIYLAGTLGTKVSFQNVFGGNFLMIMLKMIGLDLLIVPLLAVSLLCFIIPFFFVFPRVVLATYYLIDKDMGVMDALSASWRNMKGNVGKAYGIVGATLLMELLFLTIIGIPVALYLVFMYSGAFAVLYRFIETHRSDSHS